MASSAHTFNVSRNITEINTFINEFKHRLTCVLAETIDDNYKSPFISFAERRISVTDGDWLQDNEERFFKETPNEKLIKYYYLSQLGYVFCMLYSPDGKYLIVGYSTGLVQIHHGRTGAALYTLRAVQFPPKPIYALEYSRTEERVCYAACMDGAVYRIEIPFIPDAVDDGTQYGIKANPGLDCLQMQFYAAPGPSACSTPFISSHAASWCHYACWIGTSLIKKPYAADRFSALSLGITADSENMVVGYTDGSIKVFDMETQEATRTYKVHKLRLQFIPKKLQRMHTGRVVALKCHDDRPFVFASAAWDKTIRIWDTRCQVGCSMTFEGVDVCSDSIDLKRNFCLAGSWQATEALTVWDIVAKKQVSIVRVQNRRPDVDGEFIYACRFWNSSKYNRKAKYGIIGGSGTNCVEIVNLHNRYITCSYPAEGTVLAITSHEDLIAFGGTAPVLNIVSFHDPKHEKYPKEPETTWECLGLDPDDVVLYEGEYDSGVSTEAELNLE